MTVRRIKSYTGETGFVYHYYFVGKRPALPGAVEEAATEYVFDVSSNRESYVAVSIFLYDSALRSWASAHERELTDAEQYAVAKLRLLAALDEVSQLTATSRQFAVGPDDIEAVLDPLDLT